MPNGTYTTYTYSTRSWLTAITHKKSDTSTFLSISYQFDKDGNPTTATENNGDVTDYTYDDLYRLTRETKEDSQQQTIYDYSYTYDAVGNRTKKRDEVAQSDTNYTNNNMNQMTAAGNITYTYDDAGNMLTKVVNQETTNYTWDFRNKMLKVDFPSGDDPVMRYNGAGARVEKAVGASITKFLYAGGGLAFETDGSDSEVAEYRRSSRGRLIATERGSTLYWYHFDALGTARALTNSSETLTDTYKYDAWGQVTASTGSTTNRLRFVGEQGYYDEGAVGLLLLRTRWYSPAHGRFVSRDPMGNELNAYVYAGNRPATLADPSGLFPCSACIWVCFAGPAACAACYALCTPAPPPPPPPAPPPSVQPGPSPPDFPGIMPPPDQEPGPNLPTPNPWPYLLPDPIGSMVDVCDPRIVCAAVIATAYREMLEAWMDYMDGLIDEEELSARLEELEEAIEACMDADVP